MTSTHYPTDLTNAQWENLLPYLPEPSSLGRPLKWEMRSIIKRYVLHSQVRVSMANAPSSDATPGKRSIPTSESGKLMVHGL